MFEVEILDLKDANIVLASYGYFRMPTTETSCLNVAFADIHGRRQGRFQDALFVGGEIFF